MSLFWPKSSGSGCCCGGSSGGPSYADASMHFYLSCPRTGSRPHVSFLTLLAGQSTPVNMVYILRFGGTITGGTFRLDVGAETTANIAWSSTTATLMANVEAALLALTAVVPGDVVITDGAMIAGIGDIYIESTGTKGGTSALGISVDNNSLTGSLPTVGTPVGVSAAASLNGLQQFIIDGAPTGGTFKLGFDGQTTASITWSATATTLRDNVINALKALSNVGSTGVSGVGLVPTQVRFVGPLAATAVPRITVEENLLTGDTLLPLVGADVEVFKNGVSAGTGVTDSDGNVLISLTHFGVVMPIQLTSTEAYDCLHTSTTSFTGPGATAIRIFDEYYRVVPFWWYFAGPSPANAPIAGVTIAVTGQPGTEASSTTADWSDSGVTGADGYWRSSTYPGIDTCNSRDNRFDYTYTVPGSPPETGTFTSIPPVGCGKQGGGTPAPEDWPV